MNIILGGGDLVIVVAVTDVLTAVVVSKASEPLGEGELVIVVVE